jgi:hypothetical protein
VESVRQPLALVAQISQLRATGLGLHFPLRRSRAG